MVQPYSLEQQGGSGLTSQISKILVLEEQEGFCLETKARLQRSDACTNSLWFVHFATGCHRQMGSIWIPDQALTINKVKGSMLVLEEDLKAYGHDLEGQKQTCLTVITVISGFFAALRGEEIVRADLGALREYWQEAVENSRAPHIPLMLAGRTDSKGRQEKSYSANRLQWKQTWV